LNDGANPANGVYDLAFMLFDANSGGSAVAGPITNTATAVSNGLFTVMLDFGTGVFTGPAYWLEMGVRSNGGSSFTTLSPRQLITPSPYAIYAPNAGAAQTAGSASAVAPGGTVPLTALPTAVLTNGAGSVSLSGAFTGNGSGLTNVPASWQTISGSSQTAVANQAYLLTNNALDTLTLPALPNVGDVVTVSGVGTNGWQVAAAPGQTIVGAPLGGPSGIVWTLQSGAPSVGGPVVCSADGSHLVTAVWGGAAYTSTNYGTNWTAGNGGVGASWNALACSADGSRVVGASYNGGFWTSTDFGADWTAQVTQMGYWDGLACSSDGSHLVAGMQQGGLYTSVNYGTNWTPQMGEPGYLSGWQAVASSSDGSHLVAVWSSGIYTSVNFGTSWTQQAGPPYPGTWQAVASCADGSHLVAVAYGGAIHTSTNYGTNWMWQPGAPTLTNWEAVASSADGSRLLAAVYGGGIYTSTNFGVNWTLQNGAPVTNDWYSLAFSSNGIYLVAVAINGGIYTSGPSPLPYPGVAGTVAQFQYVGSGVWQPLTQSAGAISAATLFAAMVTNCETGVTLGGTFSGNGSGLTSLPAAVVTNGETGVTLNGTFSGNGSGLTSIPVPAGIVTNGETGVTLGGSFSGAFSGNGAGLTNLPTGGGGGEFGMEPDGQHGHHSRRQLRRHDRQ
jgi:hypothetical protein